jgi:hypothetical protein
MRILGVIIRINNDAMRIPDSFIRMIVLIPIALFLFRKNSRKREKYCVPDGWNLKISPLF